jgi:hypothetical protein
MFEQACVIPASSNPLPPQPSSSNHRYYDREERARAMTYEETAKSADAVDEHKRIQVPILLLLLPSGTLPLILLRLLP